MIASKRQLVAAARAGALDRADVVLPGLGAGGLEGVAGLVGELAEIDLVGVACAGQHADVRARAEYVVLAGAQHDGLDLGMLEAHPLHYVGEFDIDAEIVGIELQAVALEEAALLGDIHVKRCCVAVIRDAPMAVARRVRLKVDALGHPAYLRGLR